VFMIESALQLLLQIVQCCSWGSNRMSPPAGEQHGGQINKLPRVTLRLSGCAGDVHASGSSGVDVY
jgi:hypothetical protein